MTEITVIRGGAIGDFVLTLPAIAALRQAFPEARLRLIGHPPILRLARPELIVDQDSALLTPLYTEGDIPASTTTIFAHSQFMLAYLADSYPLLTTNLRALVRGPLLVHDPRPPAGTMLHMTEYLLQPLYEQGIGISNHSPRIELRATDHEFAVSFWRQHNLPSPTTIIHPGSGGRHKCWPLERYLELIDRLQQRDIASVVLCGPAENDLKDRLPDGICTLHPPGLLELASLLACASLFIGNDSGPSHIAAAVGVPTLTLFGPTDPCLWAPTGSRSHILSAPAGQLSALAVNLVWETARKILESNCTDA